MPVSKQARTRQNRQIDRVVVAREEKRRRKRRRRIIGVTLVIVAILAVAGVGVWKAESGSNSTAATKQCVGLKDKLPKGAPAWTLPAQAAPTTLGIKDLKTGTGAVIKKTDTITTNYIGVACTAGNIFDSSYKTGKAAPITFPLNGVIAGWTNGIPGMKVGGIRILSIPADQAYGSNPPAGAGIPPDEPLFFLVAPTKVGK